MAVSGRSLGLVVCGVFVVFGLGLLSLLVGELELAEVVEDVEDPSSSSSASSSSATSSSTLPFGVNLWGFIRGEFGIGEASRLAAFALNASGVSMALNDMHGITGLLGQHTHKDTTWEQYGISNTPRAPYFFNVIFDSAVAPKLLYDSIGPEYFRDRYNIGIWFWELEDIPASHLQGFWYIDELWVAAEFIAQAYRRVAPVPVFTMPLPVEVMHPKQNYTREYFGLRDDDFVFLVTFDFDSISERKNPIGDIRAFKSAFPSNTSAVLFIKSSHADIHAEELAPLVEEARGARIVFMDKVLNPDEVAGLFSIADVYVSLHRVEGVGLGMVQALGLGKIVIATNYSGNTDFTTDETAFMVPYKLVPIKQNIGSYQSGMLWAEPDLQAAGQLMRFVFDHPEEARKKAMQGRDWILRHFSNEATGQRMLQRLQEIWKDREPRMRYLSKKQRNFGYLPKSQVGDPNPAPHPPPQHPAGPGHGLLLNTRSRSG